MIDVYIGLGGNLDDPLRHVIGALDDLKTLPRTRFVARSPLYLTQSFPPGNPDYINAVAKIQTDLPALALLDALQAIENNHGRVRLKKWGSRTLDLDVLLYGNDRIKSPRLTVPHACMHERPTVLYPLADIAPDLVLPCGSALQALLTQVPPVGIKEKIKESLCQR